MTSSSSSRLSSSAVSGLVRGWPAVGCCASVMPEGLDPVARLGVMA